MYRWREPAGLNYHSTAIANDQLYLWAGDLDGMPKVHDSAEKRQSKVFSSVEQFDVNIGCWEQRTMHTPNTVASSGSGGLFMCCCQE